MSARLRTAGGGARERGFSLIELLIASTIGLFIIIGAIGVFTAIRESARVAQAIDETQESLRFLAYTITRVVHSGRTLQGSSASELVVIFPEEVDASAKDCLGNSPVAVGVNRFSIGFDERVGRYELRCQAGNASPVVLAERMAGPDAFHVELLRVASDEGSLGTLVGASASEATSVRVTLEMAEFGERGARPVPVTFVATARCRILGCQR